MVKSTTFFILIITLLVTGCGKKSTKTTVKYVDSFTTYQKLDHVAKSVVEGSVFINPPGVVGQNTMINGQPAHLCSKLNNPGYNDGNRFVVEFRNNNVTGLANGENIDDINETNIVAYCYDTLFSSIDFELIQNSQGIELSDYIDYAKIIVSHTDGADASIAIEAIEIRHHLTLDILESFKTVALDYRSASSSKYKVHQDEKYNYFKQ